MGGEGTGRGVRGGDGRGGWGDGGREVREDGNGRRGEERR
jgi:hypothetical protein